MPYPLSPSEFGGNPLAADDKNLARTAPIEFGASPTGLDLRGQPAAPLGMVGMPAGLVEENEQLMQSFDQQSRPQPVQQEPLGPQLFYSPSTGDIVVNGFTFNQRNASRALVSEEFANQPARQFTLPDTATDWRPMSRPEYDNYLNTIRNPGMGRRMGEAWEHAWRGVGDTALGASLTVNPEWEWGQEARQNILREYEENAPFMLGLRDVKDVGSGLTYVSQLLVQGVPWMIETIASMAIGGVIGGTVSGGVGAPAGAVEGFLAKEALRRATTEAIRGTLSRGALAYRQALAARTGAQTLTREAVTEQALRTGAASADDVDRFFSFGERAFHSARGGEIGSRAAMAASNYMVGVGDIRNAIADAGGDPTSAESVAQIWGMAIPYAAIESVGDLIITRPIAHLFPGGTARGTSTVLGGALRAAPAEAIQESAQYGITQTAVANATDTPISIEPYDLLENALGGFFGGAGIGGVAGLAGKFGRENSATPPPPTGSPSDPLSGSSQNMGGLEFNVDDLPDMGYQLNEATRSGMYTNQRGQLPGIAGMADERDYLRNSLNDPTLTDDQRSSIVQSLDALQGGQDVDVEVAARGADSVGRGGAVDPPIVPQPYVEPEILDTSYRRERDPTAMDMMQDRVDMPPGLVQSERSGRSRHPTEIFQDLAIGKDVELRELQVLRDTIQQLAFQNPTNPGYASVLSQLDDIRAGMRAGPVTDENSDEFQRRYPELTTHIANGPRPVTIPEPIVLPPDAELEERINPRRPQPGKLKPVIKRGIDPKTMQSYANTWGNIPDADSMAANIEQTPSKADSLKKGKKKKNRTGAQKRKNKLKRRHTDDVTGAGSKFRRDSQQSQSRREALTRELELEARDEARETDERFRKEEERLQKAQQARSGGPADTDPKQVEEILDAFRKRSTETKAVPDKPRASEKDGSGDTAKPEAPAESTEQTEQTEQGVPRAEVNEARVNAAYEAGIKEYPTALEFYQGVAGLLSRSKKYAPDASVRTTKDWAKLGGKPITPNELHALIAKLKPERDAVKAGGKDKKTTDRRAASFGEALSEAKKQNKFDPKSFSEFVLTSEDEVRAWLKTTDAEVRAGLASEAKRILDAKPPATQRAANEGFTPTQEEIDYAKGMWLHGTPNPKAAKGLRKQMFGSITGWFEDGTWITKRPGAANLYANKNANSKNPLTPNKPTVLLLRVNGPIKLFESYGDYDTFPRRALAARKAGYAGWTVRGIIEGQFEDGEVFIFDPKKSLSPWFDGEPATQRAADGPRILRNPRSPQGGIVFNALRRVLKENPEFTFRPVHPATRAKAKLIIDEIHREQVKAGFAKSSIQSLTAQLAVLRRELRKEGNTQRNVQNEGNAGGESLSVEEAQRLTKEVQKRINYDMRFETIHVFKDAKDMFARAPNEMMHTANGGKISLGRYILRGVEQMKAENPGIAKYPEDKLIMFFIQEYLLGRAVTVNDHNALIVFTENLFSERALLETLEHEYVVHKGLGAVFKDWVERAEFMERVRKIPGVEDKLKQLLVRYPGYANINLHLQVEELLAVHSQDGPLALERLLSAPEAIDPATKRTLWEDFKRLVMDWINRVFSGFRSNEDKALDAVISALRQRAIIGDSVDLHKILDEHNIAKIDVDFKVSLDDLKKPGTQKAEEATVDPTRELLFDIENNPGRPYERVLWRDTVVPNIRANLPLMEKMKKLSGTTSMREALRKVGRNIEPMNNMSLRSALVEKMMEIMHNTINVARRIMTKRQETRQYASKSATTAPVRSLFGDKNPGSTEKGRKGYNRMAIAATNHLLPQATESVVRDSPRLIVRHENGMYDINARIYNDKGKDVSVFGKLLDKGTLTKEQFYEGVEQFTVSGDGKRQSNGVAKLPKDVIDAGYDIYVLETQHMANSALEVLEHNLIMLNQMNDTMVAKLVKDNEFKAEDRPFTTETLQRMYKLYTDIAFRHTANSSRTDRIKQKETARQVLIELMRTMHSKDKLSDWLDAEKKQDETAKSPRKQNAFKWREQTNPHEDVKPFASQIAWFLAKDETTGKPRLERMNDIYASTDGQRQYDMLGAFQHLLNSETQAYQRENQTIQSILGNYVEFTRGGDWRVFVEVQNLDGTAADIDPELLAVLPVTYTPSQREALELQAERMEALKGEHEATIINAKTGENEKIKVKFDVGYGRAPQVSTLAEAPSIKQFMEVANIAGLALNAPQMKQLANLVENASKRKMFGLQRAGTPGMDADILANNNDTMTRRAWTAAKMSQAWMLDDTFNDKRYTEGDWRKLARLQREFDIANRGAPEGETVPTSFVRNEQAVYLTETALLRYANQLRYMAKSKISKPNVVIRTTKGEQKLKVEPEGEAHRNHAKALRESLDKNELELNLNDLLSKTGHLRMLAVVMQLGSLASGIMNAFTLITHLPWVLMARHSTTGYGEGFSMSEIVSEIMTAATQMMLNPMLKRIDMEDSAVVKGLLDKAKAGDNSTGLSVEELEFLYQQTLEGLLMPQQTYSMTGGTESNITNLILRALAEFFLKPFGAMEAANRRISALVTYRLAKQRYVAAGVDPKKFADVTSEEYKRLAKDAQRVVWNSQGDYSNINRPKGFRGDLAQYVLMYKMFPLMTQIMLFNLPRAQQLSVLAVLFLLGGLKGEPFADDLMDIYDTLLQKMGIRHDSVELQLIQTLESIQPGLSKWIMYGGIDTLAFGGTMSSRISMGDIIPMTGAFRDGVDWGRELDNAFGPAYAANRATLEYAWLLTEYVLELSGIKPPTTSWEQLIRKMPQSQLRALGEAGLMWGTGEITDPQGRLTSDEVTAWSIFARAVGLYPLEATKANTAVRLDRMHTQYMRSVRARFVLAYANAYRKDDDATMERITRAVDDWNRSAEETGQEDMMIRNFRSAAIRAGRANAQTTVERTAASAPDYSLLEEVAEALNADTEAEDD